MDSASARIAWSSNHGSSMYACDSGHRTSLYVSFMSVSVEGVSAFVAEFVDIAVLDVFLAAVRAFVYLVHAGKIDHLCVSTIGAVVRGEELIEGLHYHIDRFVEVRVCLVSEAAEDADRKVTLEIFVVHVK